MNRGTNFWWVAGLLVFSATTHAAPHPRSSDATKKSWSETFPEGERALYVRALEAYRAGELRQLVRLKDMLLKRYPKSVYADNTLYITGMLLFQRGQQAEALRHLDLITQRYPKSNKVPGALYAKSVVYSKLNLPDLSRQLLKNLVERYPGSPESQRAWIDLRSIEKRGS